MGVGRPKPQNPNLDPWVSSPSLVGGGGAPAIVPHRLHSPGSTTTFFSVSTTVTSPTPSRPLLPL
jgi:hypothetical protein